jgi:hypothetical protein
LLPALYTTLDDEAQTITPVRGSGLGTLTGIGAADFVADTPCHQGLRISTETQYVDYLVIGGTALNLSYIEGTVRFWFKPEHDPEDGVRRMWFETRKLAGGEYAPGGISAGREPNGDLKVRVITLDDPPDNPSLVLDTIVPASAYAEAYREGVWSLVMITWDGDRKEQNVHVYFNDLEVAQYAPGAPDGLFDEQVAADNHHLAIGGVDSNMGGVIDDFQVYTATLTPTARR